MIAEKDDTIAKKDEELASLKSTFQDQVLEKDEAIAEQDDELAEKDKAIFSLKAKMKKIGQMTIESDVDSSDEEDGDVEEEQYHPAKRRRTDTESGHSGNGQTQTNRATRNRARRVQVKHENIKAGEIKCPDPQCNNIILHVVDASVLLAPITSLTIFTFVPTAR